MNYPGGGAQRGTSRRWFLAGGAAALLGAGAGVAAEFWTHETPPPRRPTPPQVLVDAAAAERALLADLDATTGGTPAVRSVIRQVRADHAAHLRALTELIATYGVPAGGRPSSVLGSASAAPGTPRTRAALRGAERRAATAAARRADQLTGGHAALLASIAAAETTHADLLS
ncbi:MAG TPA: hypothetical protein VFU35_02135 [Jatrophihabitans sp.]|nr:hypothetical protein [Jatrophihabitans sp.]